MKKSKFICAVCAVFVMLAASAVPFAAFAEEDGQAAPVIVEQTEAPKATEAPKPNMKMCFRDMIYRHLMSWTVTA